MTREGRKLSNFERLMHGSGVNNKALHVLWGMCLGLNVRGVHVGGGVMSCHRQSYYICRSGVYFLFKYMCL